MLSFVGDKGAQRSPGCVTWRARLEVGNGGVKDSHADGGPSVGVLREPATAAVTERRGEKRLRHMHL